MRDAARRKVEAMNKTKALAWFDEVANMIPGPRSHRPPPRVRDVYEAPRYGRDDGDEEDDAREAAALAFVMPAEQAIKRVFPPGDPVVRRWDEIFKEGTSAGALTNEVNVDAAVALFREAHKILKSDRFATLMDGVRAETVGELVDQAEALLARGWLAAAMVTAGGAVEGALRHLCASATPPITIEGHGSIEKYNAAIGKRRNEGAEVLTANQSKMVTAWGGYRNAAAHDPLEFADVHSKESLRAVIDGIRQFLGNLEP